MVIDPEAFYEVKPAHTFYLDAKFKIEDGIPPKLTDHQYIICDRDVPGYSLNEKKWAYFYVDFLGEIPFNDQVFQQSLILEEKYKKMILSLVQAHSIPGFGFDDVIKGKGRGVVILLHGEPGVGKTLTAGKPISSIFSFRFVLKTWMQSNFGYSQSHRKRRRPLSAPSA